MNLFEVITQSELNDAIDLLLNNYHREISLNIDDSINDYCSLEFDLSDGVDAGDEIIFNDGDNLGISISDKRLALMGYTLRFFYYQLDKGDYTGGKDYGDLQSFDVKLDEDTVTVPFTDNQVYLQKGFSLILLKDVGYRLLLDASSTMVVYGDDVVLTADYTYGSVPVEDASVEFYNGETLIDTVDTDEDGLAVLTVSDLPVGSHNFSCICNGVYSNNLQVTVDKITPVISLSSNKSMVITGGTYTLSGVLDIGSGKTVKLYEGESLIEEITTVTGGAFSKTIISTESRLNNYKAVYDGDATHESVTSSNVSVMVSDTLNHIEMKVSGSSFSSLSPDPFSYVGKIFVDWGDGTLVEYSGGKLAHTYESTDDYTVKIYGNITSFESYCLRGNSNLIEISIPDCVMNIGQGCFQYCSNLTLINIPDSVASIGGGCFRDCSNLTEIRLNWDSSSEIITYDSTWLRNTPSNLKFSIPLNTTSLYTAKGYSSDKLVERNS